VRPHTNSVEYYLRANRAVFDDGSAMACAVVGGLPHGDEDDTPSDHVRGARIEECVLALSCLAKANAKRGLSEDYDLRLGIEWAGGQGCGQSRCLVGLVGCRVGVGVWSCLGFGGL
jgi:hypothetical protein